MALGIFMQKIFVSVSLLFMGSVILFCPFSTHAADETTVEHLRANDFQGLSGSSVGLHNFDDQAVSYTLPFAFRFYGTDYTTVFVSTNGFLQFGSGSQADDCCAMNLSDSRPPRIYALGEDLVTYGTDEDVYVTTTSTSITFRWQAELIVTGEPTNFEIALYSNGNFELNYGDNPDPINYFPTVIGISNGAGLQTASVYNEAHNFDRLQTVYWGELPTDPTPSSDAPDRADIDSYKGSLSVDQTACPQKLKLTVKGHHFDDRTQVFIGGKEASSVDVSDSRKLSAEFCLEKLLSAKKMLRRTVSAKNPHTDLRRAAKKIDLGQFIPATAPQVSGTVKNIQSRLVELGYLDSRYVTGIYGSITSEAVKKFQGDKGIEQTGTVGPKTHAQLQAGD